jgi:sec-independent protein translocase protein TatA
MSTLLFIGAPEIMIILLIVLLLFGSKRIPELARGLGKGLRQFKDATQGLQSEIENSAREVEREANINKHMQQQQTAKQEKPPVAPAKPETGEKKEEGPAEQNSPKSEGS